MFCYNIMENLLYESTYIVMFLLTFGELWGIINMYVSIEFGSENAV